LTPAYERSRRADLSRESHRFTAFRSIAVDKYPILSYFNSITSVAISIISA
jgi:hypothetical protein